MLRKTQQGLVAICTLVAAAAFAYYVSSHPMDFRVYHYGARGVFDGTRPVYGLTSGLGWPMHYRYPPLFLLLFAPFAMLSLGWGAAIWVVLKMVTLVGLVGLVGTKDLPKPGTLAYIPVLFVTPYLIEEFRYGNAQFFVFALTAASLLIARKRPLLSAASLALGISIKVWPLFFIPYLAARRDWKVAGYALCFVVLLSLLPSFYFGFQGNVSLLGQWFAQESQTQLGESEIWFPNQSLRGVLMRYLTVIDYSRVPDSNYPLVNIASLDPATVRLVWFLLAGAAYAMLLFIAARRRNTEGWFEHGLAFCMLALLEPFTQKYALVVLLWPALAARFLTDRPKVRILIYAATILALIQPLIPGSAAQRLLQVLGLDFAAAALLTIAMVIACLTSEFTIPSSRRGPAESYK
jgi:hypothetical protein